MKKAALVVMAAGMASRYGSAKQIDGMGPNGEILMEYSIHDAIRAGFTKVVFIVRDFMIDDMKEICGDRIAREAEVCYAPQEYASIPKEYTIPAGRTKPYGTVHAVLCAAPYVSEPFAIINADDYYGVDGYKTMYDFLTNEANDSTAAMMGFALKNTVSENGTVTRGVCQVDNGCLTKIVETKKIGIMPDGRMADIEDPDHPAYLDANVPVSMNFWGFAPSIFGKLDTYLRTFLKELPEGDMKTECLLPTFVDEMLHSGLTVKVLSTDAKWFGVTYKEDRPGVVATLQKLHDDGVYGVIHEK